MPGTSVLYAFSNHYCIVLFRNAELNKQIANINSQVDDVQIKLQDAQLSKEQCMEQVKLLLGKA